MKRYVVLLIASMALAGTRARAEESDLARRATAILETHCGRCHGKDGSSEGGLNYILDVKKLVERRKIVPGQAEKSRLFRRMADGDMPPEGEQPRLQPADLAVVKAWINGTRVEIPPPAAETTVSRPFVGTGDNLQAMLQHLRRTPRTSRPFQRYFTFTHLHNNPSISMGDLRLFQAALSKLLNSLSWKAAIVVPQSIDDAQTVYAVDIRKLDWDRRQLWSEILQLYPYGLKHDRYPDDDDARDVAREIYELAGTELPAVRADWFLATAARPPLYHTLLQLPADAGALEKKLGVDVRANFLRNQAVRAGFNGSGVSRQNRLVERHESAYGAYWKSYDFKSNDGPGNLFRFPLGPGFDGNPFANQAFSHDGGEIIFHLPNGLQGYLLIDARDARIDAGPTEVVRDKTETAGSVAIVNGLSCMACHRHGMIRDFRDAVREGSALAGQALDKVRDLYVRPAEMDRLLQEDEERFLRALDRATGLFLKVDQDRDIRDFPEVIGPLARQFLLKEVGLTEAACELGLKEPAALQAVIKAVPRLRELGLMPLVNGGTIKRETWESTRALVTPFQEVARALELGVPCFGR